MYKLTILDLYYTHPHPSPPLPPPTLPLLAIHQSHPTPRHSPTCTLPNHDYSPPPHHHYICIHAPDPHPPHPPTHQLLLPLPSRLYLDPVLLSIPPPPILVLAHLPRYTCTCTYATHRQDNPRSSTIPDVCARNAGYKCVVA